MSAHCMITSVLVPSTLHNDALWSQFIAYLFIWYRFCCIINIKMAFSYNMDIIVLVVCNSCMTDFSSKQRQKSVTFWIYAWTIWSILGLVLASALKIHEVYFLASYMFVEINTLFPPLYERCIISCKSKEVPWRVRTQWDWG